MIDIAEFLIRKDIQKDPLHIGTFTDEEIENIKKQYTKSKKQSLFD